MEVTCECGKSYQLGENQAAPGEPLTCLQCGKILPVRNAAALEKSYTASANPLLDTPANPQAIPRRKNRASLSRIRWLPHGWLQPIRNYLRSDMVALRWVLLGLYLLIVALLLASRMFDRLYLLALIAITLGCQAFFIFGTGTVNFCRPVRKRRLWMPLLVAASLCTVLVGGMFIAMSELFYLNTFSGIAIWFWVFVGVNWVAWFFILFFATRDWNRMQVLGRLTGGLIAGSLAELLATVPAHMIVTRRPGCLVGIGTMCGILAGLYSMMFAFGPGVILLFLRPRYLAEKATLESGAPPPPRHYQFQLRTVFLIMMVCSIVFGWVSFELNQAWQNQRSATDIYEVEERLRERGAEVGYHFVQSPDSLDAILDNPGKFYIGYLNATPQCGDDSLALLKDTPRLESIHLEGKQVTDEGLKHLRHLRLNSVELHNTSITGEGLQYLKGMPIWNLSLENSDINDDGLKQLRSLENLSNLNLDGTKVTDDGLEHLVDLPIASLKLNNTNVTDAALPHLLKMKSLGHLEIQNTQSSKSEVTELLQTRRLKVITD